MDLYNVAEISIRALCLAGIAQLLLWICRIRSAHARHAVWTAVTLGMALQAVLTPFLPPLPIRILPATTATAVAETEPAAVVGFTLPARPLAPSAPRRDQAIVWLYGAVTLFFLARLVIGFSFTRSLLKRSKRIDGQAIATYECAGIASPMTIGWLRPKILLPTAWREWDQAKLRAVLAHEEAHIRRADWAIAVIARLNRCVFWFHPLSWWLEHRLAALAEQVCDDAALAVVADRHQYAQALLDIAQSVRSNRGRFIQGATAMAKRADVRQRIDRILDEARPIPSAFPRAQWAVLLAFGLPGLYLTSAAHLSPAAAAQAQQTAASLQPLSPYERWLTEDVAYIIAPEERQAFERLSRDEERIHFIEQFWLRRDPTPGTSVNELKEEHYRRIAYSNQRYGSTRPGWKTDRGRIYITLGPPDEIESHPSGGSQQRLREALNQASLSSTDETPFEIWTYPYVEGVGNNIKMGFIDPARSGEYRMVMGAPLPPGYMPPFAMFRRDAEYTPEARAARIEGATWLEVVVGSDGTAQSIRVTRPLEPGLDQKAIECVRGWHFRPANLEGKPVSSVLTVRVPFRL